MLCCGSVGGGVCVCEVIRGSPAVGGASLLR